MDVRAELITAASPAALFEVVADLGTYPDWLDIVGRAESTPSADGDVGPAWLVDLQGQLGPLRRSKRLRMVRTECEAPRSVRFERRDVDGRDHSDWVLHATVADGEDGGSRLEVHLHYGGSLWVPLLDRLLADEIRSSRRRLAELVAS